MDNLFWIGFVGAALALIFAYLQKCKVMKCSEGDEKMVKIASSIRAGANAYLKQQYSTVAKVFAVVFVILLIIAFASKGQMLSRVTPFAFLTGGIWSMLAGLIGMKIATAANARTANAAHESLNHGLNVASLPARSWASRLSASAFWTSRSGLSACATLARSPIPPCLPTSWS